MIMDNKINGNKCVIIGSGLAGLSIGAVLSRSGCQVTVLEQSGQMGGFLQCFYRGNAKFETGMHIVGSLDEGQVLSHYLNFLDIKDKVQFSRLDTHAYDIVKLYGECFSFPNGHQAMIEHFSSRFPKEKDSLVRYWQLIDKIAETTPFYSLSDERQNLDSLIGLSTRSINEVLDTFFQDTLLKEVLMGNKTLYAAQRNRTPFSSHAFINNLYNKSAFRIVGGSDNMAKALSDQIVTHGGTVRVNSRVSQVLCENGEATAAVLSTGEVVTGDLFISTIHPSLMTTLCPHNVLRPAYVKRLRSIPNTKSVFSIHLQFRPNKVPYSNSNYFVYNSGSPWDLENYNDDTWPRGYFYMHGCQIQDPLFATTGVVFASMSVGELTQWVDTSVGCRGAAYEDFKRRKAEGLLAAVERDFPGITSDIENYYTATPLTYRDYTSTPDGSIYGMTKDITLGVGGRVSYRTRIPNFFLAGQSVKAHGILGVLSGTIDVCSAILGEAEVRKSMLERNASSMPTPPLPY